MPTLPPVPGDRSRRLHRRLEERFRNPAIRHRTLQISADGSQKLPPRLVEPALDRLRAGARPLLIALSIAAWMRFLLGRTEAGATYAIADPMVDRLCGLARENGGPDGARRSTRCSRASRFSRRDRGSCRLFAPT